MFRPEQLVDRLVSPAFIIGASPAILAVKEQLDAVQSFPMVTVLLEGETGTGKELIAEVLHDATFGARAPFVPINCPAIPDHLLESELFGYEKGAFTDARSTKPGLLELANGGTLFLDEVGSLSASVQPKLLRVLETKTFTRLGSLRKIEINCRIVSATNKSLHELVDSGAFREDLYYRLAVFPINIPPLRNRLGDVSLIAQAFVKQLTHSMRREIRGITPEALATLEAYHWPGNVRELRKIIERAIILTAPNAYIDKGAFPPELSMGSHKESVSTLSLRDMEKQHLATILSLCRGNKTSAAKVLGISRTTLRKLLHE